MFELGASRARGHKGERRQDERAGAASRGYETMGCRKLVSSQLDGPPEERCEKGCRRRHWR
ncbi:hypothetical protein WQQ_34110 [Hydrocarboniphaga effusa AP103]|uniref:Uncharacterized protein n=1 Tax=Hydrocarboniphaga effusa AP103 TaxID=1172194 RepID=I7ZD62_9GAMM|nr:hypothetical protein WQQ_34110 [Hydrocarboniphaga effusa AP103]